MADKFWTGVLGTNLVGKVVKGAAATPANPFDVRITYDATGVAKGDAVKFLRATIDQIVADTWPPA